MEDMESENKACFNLDIYQAIQSHKKGIQKYKQIVQGYIDALNNPRL